MKKRKSEKQLTAEIREMNRRIIKEKLKDPLYIPGELDLELYNEGEYKANKKKTLVKKKKVK